MTSQYVATFWPALFSHAQMSRNNQSSPNKEKQIITHACTKH